MSRQRVSKGQLILKKEQKFKIILESLVEPSEQDFINKFKELYPEDWRKIIKRYNEHERLKKPEKSHPMPHPEKYLSNAYKTFMKKEKLS